MSFSDLAKQAKLIIPNKEMDDIMKIVKSLEQSDLLIKDVSGTIKNEAQELKGGFHSMLLGTLGASLLRNLLTGKGMKLLEAPHCMQANIFGRRVMR